MDKNTDNISLSDAALDQVYGGAELRQMGEQEYKCFFGHTWKVSGNEKPAVCPKCGDNRIKPVFVDSDDLPLLI